MDQSHIICPSAPIKPCIRTLALGWITHQGRIFVHEGYDSVKQSTFYRSLGGGIEFGETSLEALKREFQEEIQAELINIRYLACIENLFVHEGKAGHELIQLYQCDFADPRFYQLTSFIGQEGGQEFKALWVEGDRFRSGELRLVPEQCLTFLEQE